MLFDSGSGETLTRFIMQKNHVPADASLKHNPFMPPPTGRLSIYAISSVDETEIWSIGVTHVAAVREKPLHGRADFNSRGVYDLGLKIEMVPDPHPLHAEIVGWDPASTETRLIALKLAAQATFRRAPAA